jgi:acetyl-CoA carboxylase biotin carboxyl carrier protein
MATDNKSNTSSGMTVHEVISIIKAVSDSNIENFEFTQGDTHISLSGRKAPMCFVPGEMPPPPFPMAVPAPAPAEAPAEASAEPEKKENVQEIKSPLVGVFYRSPAAGEKPFVSIGDTVKKGQVLGIIEAMKMMNEIESEFDGVIEEILVENEGKVEFGQTLFRISK